MTKEELVDILIETNFSQLYLFQKILLKRMLLLDGEETRHYSANRNVPMCGLKGTSRHFDELYGKDNGSNGKDENQQEHNN